ncbi:MAG: N-acetyltransferase [Bacteroidetes bacterium]|nr:N-acetyltransferase [Bacteroidota bacterium]
MKFNNINVRISSTATIGQNVKIGDDSVILDNVVIGDDSIICNNCVIGEPTNDYYYDENYINPKTIIGAGAMVRSHSIIYAGCVIGDNFSTGHRVTIREKMEIGNNCRVGTLCDLQGHSVMGDYCWLHSNVHIGQKSKIGNYVFIYPYTVFTNDPHPPSNICIGPQVDDYSQIAVGVILLPGVKIGKHVLIGAHSVVGKDVADYQLVVGNPAKPLKDVRELIAKDTGVSHYPWPYHFSRGMPWQEEGYEKWKSKN